MPVQNFRIDEPSRLVGSGFVRFLWTHLRPSPFNSSVALQSASRPHSDSPLKSVALTSSQCFHRRDVDATRIIDLLRQVASWRTRSLAGKPVVPVQGPCHTLSCLLGEAYRHNHMDEVVAQSKNPGTVRGLECEGHRVVGHHSQHVKEEDRIEADLHRLPPILDR